MLLHVGWRGGGVPKGMFTIYERDSPHRQALMGASKMEKAIRILEECSDPTSAERGSQSVLKVLQSLAGCAVYGMLDGLSSNVSSGHNTKMYTTALGPLLYAICNPHATYL